MELSEIINNPETRRFLDFIIWIFIGGSTLIQISPIKINPWDIILNWIGDRLTKGLQDSVDELKGELVELWVLVRRHLILSYARECRRNIDHSIEEWHFIISIMEQYENYCRREKIDNGVVKEDSKYIRELYHQLLQEHKL